MGMEIAAVGQQNQQTAEPEEWTRSTRMQFTRIEMDHMNQNIVNLDHINQNIVNKDRELDHRTIIDQDKKIYK